MQVIHSTRSGAVCTVLIDNPPVNATSVDVRRGLMEAFEQAEQDPQIRAIVLACAGNTFVAGADIKEFGKPPQSPHLTEVIAKIEACSKPVVAAIQGNALGGGLELALGCHYRVAAVTAKLGLPETTLGIIPGAGGIPRLQRLIGTEQALEVATTGKPMAAKRAESIGLVDALSDANLLEDAQRFAVEASMRGEGIRRIRDMEPLAPHVGYLETLRKKLATTHRGQLAPQVCVDIAEHALKSSFDESVEYGRERFRELVVSPQAAALRHAFFAERVATKPQGLPKADERVHTAGVVGGGTMGVGIALCLLNAGIAVTLVEQSESVLAVAKQNIQKVFDSDLDKGRITSAVRQQRIDALSTSLDYQSLSNCDVVIEAVFEEMELKRKVLAQIEMNVRPDTIVATNTSYLNLDELAVGMARPENVVGMHFFSPAHIMKLLENVRGAKSSPSVLANIQALGKRMGKVSVLVGVSEGFVGNRMLSRRARECYFLLEEGALPDQIDRVLFEFGFPMGQFQLNDLAGLDVAWRARQGRLSRLSDRERANGILDELVVARKRLGQKSGAGFYQYDAQRQRSVDPDVSELIERESLRLGFKRRAISDDEIRERCLYVLINEGAKILEEGVATRAEEIDTIWLNGYGFPRHRGGPMFYADQIGLHKVLQRIRDYSNQIGSQYWTPSRLLVELAEKNSWFYAEI